MNEERWAQNMEWAEERRKGLDVEIKIVREISDGTCAYKKCVLPAIREYEIGRVNEPYGTRIPLCYDHDSDGCAYEVFHQR